MPHLQDSWAVNNGILNGKLVAERVKAPIREQTALLAEQGITLTLAVVRVGADPASEVYVRGKVRACAEVGILSRHHHLEASVTEAEIVALVEELNNDDSVDGILVQLPLPPGISESRIIAAVDPRKDVDGFHPLNLGQLFSGRSLLEPCTPAGCMLLLDAAGVSLAGKRAVVVGRSVIVGRPVAQMLVRADATVTMCHRFTEDLGACIAQADVVVVAAGVPGLIRGSWVKPGAAIIDVGINRLPTGKLTGDVEFEEAHARAGVITPVPGGVGPMTVAMLLWNTLVAAMLRRRLGMPRPAAQAWIP